VCEGTRCQLLVPGLLWSALLIDDLWLLEVRVPLPTHWRVYNDLAGVMFRDNLLHPPFPVASI
jgi:hypothetical protein